MTEATAAHSCAWWAESTEPNRSREGDLPDGRGRTMRCQKSFPDGRPESLLFARRIGGRSRLRAGARSPETQPSIRSAMDRAEQADGCVPSAGLQGGPEELKAARRGPHPMPG